MLSYINEYLFGCFNWIYFRILILFIFIEIREKCFISGDKTKLLHKQIQVLVRQAARWSTAAKQDKSSLVAVLHANYTALDIYGH